MEKHISILIGMTHKGCGLQDMHIPFVTLSAAIIQRCWQGPGAGDDFTESLANDHLAVTQVRSLTAGKLSIQQHQVLLACACT
jgi:hypothetical protein